MSVRALLNAADVLPQRWLVLISYIMVVFFSICCWFYTIEFCLCFIFDIFIYVCEYVIPEIPDIVHDYLSYYFLHCDLSVNLYFLFSIYLVCI